MRAPRVLAVDIGAGHVACGVFAVGASGRLVLQQFALEPHSSDPSHDSRWAVVIAQSLGAVVARRKLSGSAAIAVPGHLALTKFIKTPSVPKEKRSKIIGFEAAENIPYPLEEVVWDYVVVSDDGFDLEVMLTASKFDAMQSLCSAADAAGFPVERATPASLALYHGFRYNYPNVHDSVIVVNVGARTTSLLFLEGERYYVRTLPLAGNTVTQALAEELRIDFSSAEALKIQVLSGKSDLPAASPSRAAVQRAATAFNSKLQLEITRSAVNHRRHSGSGAAVAVYLTGGGSLIDELPGVLAERLHLPVERYQALKNVDLAADARASGAEGASQVVADLVGLATCLIKKDETEASLLPPALTAALAFRKRQPALMLAAALAMLALVAPIVYLHSVTTATLDRVAQVDSQLMPLRSVAHRNAENLRQIEDATKQITALRGAYETKANWINFLADLQERLVKIEDVWLDKLQVVRPPPPEAGEEQQAAEGAQAAAESGQATGDSGEATARKSGSGGQSGTGDAGQVAADPNASPDAPPASPDQIPNRPPVRLTLSGRLLDVANPQSKVSPESLQRVKQLLASFTNSQFIAAVENERFDTNHPGLLKFDFTLVINPKKTL